MGIALFKGEDSKLALPPPTDWGNPIRGVPFDGSYDYFPALHPVGSHPPPLFYNKTFKTK